MVPLMLLMLVTMVMAQEHSSSKIALQIYSTQCHYFPSLIDCSRFWECYAGEACLIECANCQHELGENDLCNGRWALTFDVTYQYPEGPVCDWPAYVGGAWC